MGQEQGYHGNLETHTPHTNNLQPLQLTCATLVAANILTASHNPGSLTTFFIQRDFKLTYKGKHDMKHNTSVRCKVCLYCTYYWYLRVVGVLKFTANFEPGKIELCLLALRWEKCRKKLSRMGLKSGATGRGWSETMGSVVEISSEAVPAAHGVRL